MSDYSGDDIVIEEMPQGCIITGKDGYVVISSTSDAQAVIKSLQIMLAVQYGEVSELEAAGRKVIETFENKTRMFDALMELKEALK